MLDDLDLTDLRVTRVAALQTTGVGGSSWSVTRTSGNGITGPVSSGDAGSITGYAYQEAPDRMQALLAGSRAPVQPWRFVLISGTLLAGDVVTSVQDSSIRFTVERPQPGVLFPTAIIAPLGPQAITAPSSAPMLDFSQRSNSQYIALF
jgi:hypothetical protein